MCHVRAGIPPEHQSSENRRPFLTWLEHQDPRCRWPSRHAGTTHTGKSPRAPSGSTSSPKSRLSLDSGMLRAVRTRTRRLRRCGAGCAPWGKRAAVGVNAAGNCVISGSAMYAVGDIWALRSEYSRALSLLRGGGGCLNGVGRYALQGSDSKSTIAT